MCKGVKGGVPHTIRCIPRRSDQDVIEFSEEKRAVIICDGHGNDSDGNKTKGKEFAKVVNDECMKLIDSDIEMNKNGALLLANRFKEMVINNFKEWKAKYPTFGTTVLIVVFSEDYDSYIVVKLGDSYVMQIPSLPFDSKEVESSNLSAPKVYESSMSPINLLHKLKLTSAVKTRIYFTERYPNSNFTIKLGKFIILDRYLKPYKTV
jgi:hypothetical protein